MTSHALANRSQVDRLQRYSLLVGVAALMACSIGAFFDPHQFFRAYLPAYYFFLGLALGGLALVMIYHLTGGAWGWLVRHIIEAEMKTLPLAAAVFLPIALGLGYAYPWADPSVAAENHQTIKGIYLSTPFFYWRAAAYFAVWLTLAFWLGAWSRRQEKAGDVRTAWKCYRLSGPGLVLLGITLHFAAIDWIMSVQTDFTSTIFGPLVFAGQLLSAFAFSIMIFSWLVARPEFAGVVSLKAVNDLGSLLFTLLVLWAYLAWFQFMLIWIADLPAGSAWYLARLRGWWRWWAWAIVLLHFVVPFFLLLLRSVKQDARVLAGVAGLIFFMQFAFQYYQIMPAFDAPSIGQHWMDVFMPAGMGGIWLAVSLELLKRRPLLPLNDLNEEHATELRRTDEEEAAREEALAHG